MCKTCVTLYEIFGIIYFNDSYLYEECSVTTVTINWNIIKAILTENPTICYIIHTVIHIIWRGRVPVSYQIALTYCFDFQPLNFDVGPIYYMCNLGFLLISGNPTSRRH